MEIVVVGLTALVLFGAWASRQTTDRQESLGRTLASVASVGFVLFWIVAAVWASGQ